jgi:hypothetical protein
MLNTRLKVPTVVATLVAMLALSRVVEAGPPLICRPFDAGNAPTLAWNAGSGWRTPDPSYDLQRLTSDVLRLLTPDAPVLARMENMRRATIYALQDERIAAELLAAVVGRTTHASNDPLAWFDAGYLVESYRQAKAIVGWDMLAGADRDGYSFVKKAIALARSNPEMEFAASLMKPGAVSAEHRRRAVEGAAPGSLLAKNLSQ